MKDEFREPPNSISPSKELWLYTGSDLPYDGDLSNGGRWMMELLSGVRIDNIAEASE